MYVIDNDWSVDVSKRQQEDGSFSGDEWGEIDTRFSYCAIACLSLLGRLEVIHQEKAIDFILSCQNFDHAFGAIPFAESHAAQGTVLFVRLGE